MSVAIAEMTKQVTTQQHGVSKTLAELPLMLAEVSSNELVSNVISIFKNNRNYPGLIVYSPHSPPYFLCRRRFFELMSKPYANELFVKRSLSTAADAFGDYETLELHESTPIGVAVQKALSRPVEEMYDALVVIRHDESRMIITMEDLLVEHGKEHKNLVNTLEATLSEKDEILGIVSHDLKNPLYLIQSSLRLLKAFVTDEDGEDVLQSIETSSQHMMTLITDLLDMSALDVGRFDLDTREVSFFELVSTVYYTHFPASEMKSQRMELNTSGVDISLQVDSLKLREALSNLVSNAIKYTPSEGTIAVQALVENNYVCIRVSDSGPGISAEDQQKLFKKFQRLSAQPTGGESSTGLGLYIANRIVELHGGTISVESKLGMGATFCVTLPR